MAEPRLNGTHYCDGDQCTATMPNDGEAGGWTVWRSERRTMLLCPDCTVWSRDERDGELRGLVEQLRDRTAYLDWLVNEVCPNHNIECVDAGCPATPPGWRATLGGAS